MPSSAASVLYTLSLHDALPISRPVPARCHPCGRARRGERTGYRQGDAAGLRLSHGSTDAARLRRAGYDLQDRRDHVHRVPRAALRSEEHTSELQSRFDLVCRLLPPLCSTLFPYTTLFRSLVPYLLDAIRAVERGVGSVPDIDKAMQLGCGYPMGPLTLLDFVGLDTTYKIAEIMFTEYREQRYAPPPLLKRMVLAGMTGRKSGKGFYDYSVDPSSRAPRRPAYGC